MIQAVLWGLTKKQSQNNVLFIYNNSLGEENKKQTSFFKGSVFKALSQIIKLLNQL